MLTCLRGLCAALVALAAMSLCCLPAFALATGTVRGVVHDPNHRLVPGAQVTLQAVGSQVVVAGVADSGGAFVFPHVTLGRYRLRVEAPGFATQSLEIAVESGEAPVLHMMLALAGASTEMTVSGEASGSAANVTLISRSEIEGFAGAELSNSLRMLTEFVPGATLVHDQLHVRGGHQVTWAIDGVPLPNTNIATNVGPQFSPRDIESLEVQTGGMSADFGDRSYGVLNVAPRSGFERNRELDFAATFGSYAQTDDQLSVGDHSERSAYYASFAGYRTGYGLEPPTQSNLHNLGDGASVFTDLLTDRSTKDQLRLDAGFRADFYQVPNGPDAQAAGVRDREREQDGFAIFTWTHTLRPGLITELSPLFHLNKADYAGGVNDDPSTSDNRASAYEGGQAAVSFVQGRNNVRAGMYAFAQQDRTVFGVNDPDAATSFSQAVAPKGRLVAEFAEEQFRAASWLTLNGGLRVTSSTGTVAEQAWNPRLGAAFTVPRLRWVAHASYARFYQAPPLDTVTGSVLAYTSAQGLGFLPLRGERDEQHDFGLTIPLRGWSADLDNFRTGARNYFDHDALGNSDIFLPLTIDHARIQGWEAKLRSPLLAGHVRAHLAFSNQQAEGFGAVTGGLTDFSPPAGGFYLDHDQRNTLAAGAEATGLRFGLSGSFDFNYGSGFLNGDGPEHLPGYTTFDVSVAKQIGKQLSVRVAATNFTNVRYQLDNSNTFGGSHVGDPAMVYGELRWKLRY